MDEEKKERKREYNRQRYYKKKEILIDQAMERYYKKISQENIDKKIRALEKLGYKVIKVEEPENSG